MHALQSEGKIILIYSYFEIRVYFHPYYDMTSGYILGSNRGAILIIVPTLVFEKDCLVWATELLLAAIGLVFLALVLGYNSFNCSMYQVPVPRLIE
jgi:hypothetical protein